jgi:hypothetical protein
MANETTVEIIRGYTNEGLARRAMKGNPSSDTVKWGIVPMVMLTAEELKEAEKLVEMSDGHLEDDGAEGGEKVPDAGGAS